MNIGPHSTVIKASFLKETSCRLYKEKSSHLFLGDVSCIQKTKSRDCIFLFQFCSRVPCHVFSAVNSGNFCPISNSDHSNSAFSGCHFSTEAVQSHREHIFSGIYLYAISSVYPRLFYIFSLDQSYNITEKRVNFL